MEVADGAARWVQRAWAWSLRRPALGAPIAAVVVPFVVIGALSGCAEPKTTAAEATLPAAVSSLSSPEPAPSSSTCTVCFGSGGSP